LFNRARGGRISLGPRAGFRLGLSVFSRSGGTNVFRGACASQWGFWGRPFAGGGKGGTRRGRISGMFRGGGGGHPGLGGWGFFAKKTGGSFPFILSVRSFGSPALARRGNRIRSGGGGCPLGRSSSWFNWGLVLYFTFKKKKRAVAKKAGFPGRGPTGPEPGGLASGGGTQGGVGKTPRLTPGAVFRAGSGGKFFIFPFGADLTRQGGGGGRGRYGAFFGHFFRAPNTGDFGNSAAGFRVPAVGWWFDFFFRAPAALSFATPLQLDPEKAFPGGRRAEGRLSFPGRSPKKTHPGRVSRGGPGGEVFKKRLKGGATSKPAHGRFSSVLGPEVRCAGGFCRC